MLIVDNYSDEAATDAAAMADDSLSKGNMDAWRVWMCIAGGRGLPKLFCEPTSHLQNCGRDHASDAKLAPRLHRKYCLPLALRGLGILCRSRKVALAKDRDLRREAPPTKLLMSW